MIWPMFREIPVADERRTSLDLEAKDMGAVESSVEKNAVVRVKDNADLTSVWSLLIHSEISGVIQESPEENSGVVIDDT